MSNNDYVKPPNKSTDSYVPPIREKQSHIASPSLKDKKKTSSNILSTRSTKIQELIQHFGKNYFILCYLVAIVFYIYFWIKGLSSSLDSNPYTIQQYPVHFILVIILFISNIILFPIAIRPLYHYVRLAFIGIMRLILPDAYITKSGNFFFVDDTTKTIYGCTQFFLLLSIVFLSAILLTFNFIPATAYLIYFFKFRKR
ncbi:hypothetical protein [Streptococcus cuniculipharyngis]|uniref:Uncharacterized protein n=1 Tax=Streptococcus cuniculipharyngis TaxID=1562651 RepID=A0A5C5SE14_9STRE|nr:hypothetical protein [Streptococcus cuniculipharyngis]TWS98208.1 hypothetical protein FRX57_04560 [Streptococcus cuniculipharyngis]